MKLPMILVGSVIFPSLSGTLKSALIRTCEEGLRNLVRCSRAAFRSILISDVIKKDINVWKDLLNKEL